MGIGQSSFRTDGLIENDSLHGVKLYCAVDDCVYHMIDVPCSNEIGMYDQIYLSDRMFFICRTHAKLYLNMKLWKSLTSDEISKDTKCISVATSITKIVARPVIITYLKIRV